MGYNSLEERIKARKKYPVNYDVLTLGWDAEECGYQEFCQSDGYYYDEGGKIYNRNQENPISWRDPKEWKVQPDTTREFNHPDAGAFWGPADWEKAKDRRHTIQTPRPDPLPAYTLHRHVPFKRIYYPYTDQDNRYHKHRHKDSEPLDGRS